MLLWVGGILLVLGCIYSWENTFPQEMHSALFYNSLAFVPVTLIGIGLASESRWPATTVAAVYTAFWAAGLWILPLFPAQPRLGPVYQHITHMIPLGFPLLLIAPAIVIDLVRARSDNFKSWIAAPVAGCASLATFFAVQWPFADFLLSPAARNPIFGQAYFWYGDTANLLRDPYVFVAMEKTRGEFWIVTAASFAVAIIASVIGRGWGNALRDIRR
jgi:hypothetical protein